MSQMTVLIFDRNPHQKEYFLGSFQEEKIPVSDADTLDDFLKDIETSELLFALIDYGTLVSEKREAIVRLFKALKHHLSVVFNVPLDATKRILFYELGALRVYDRGTSIEEVYRSVKWWMQVNREGNAEPPADLQGDLQFVDFLQLLWGLGGSGKNGVLKVTTSRSVGELFFKDGQIMDARVLNHRGIDAFLHIAMWTEGGFTFRQTSLSEIHSEIYLSLPGLLILAQNTKMEIEPILRAFKSENCVVQAVNLGDLPLFNLTIDKEFLEFISIPRELAEILENPYYTNHETLRLLDRLKRFGLLRVNEPLDSLIEQNEVFAEGVSIDRQAISEIAGDVHQIEALADVLGLQEGEQAKIVVIAQDAEILRHFLSTLAGSPDRVFLDNNMYFVRLRLAETLEIILIGLHANHQLLRRLSAISGKIHGFIFLFDARRSQQKEYLSYLINHVTVSYPRPTVAAVTYLEKDQSPEAVRQDYVFTAEFPWITYSPNSQSEMLEVILNLRPVRLSESEENTESEANE